MTLPLIVHFSKWALHLSRFRILFFAMVCRGLPSFVYPFRCLYCRHEYITALIIILLALQTGEIT